jgi:tetraacyldisaccharide 4'-kinase
MASRSLAALAERVWAGRGPSEQVARAALSPLSVAFRGAVAIRDRLYAAGVLPAAEAALPAIGVGNLTVGGTGKTPIAAWVARELCQRGASPAVVLRGYGGDEPLVHAILNPSVPVIAGADRRAAVEAARRRGADVAVLDDAFQHRRLRRVADVVLVAADAWTGEVRLLPAGPWREPLSALGRAHLAVVTRKATSLERALDVAGALAAYVAHPAAVAHLAARGLRCMGSDRELPVESIAGMPVLAVAGVGDTGAFFGQLRTAGALVDEVPFPDHHAYSAAEARRLAERAETGGRSVVCTLKDAVKLEPLWPAGAPQLHYVSQAVIVERGGEALGAVLDQVLRARPTAR